MYAIVHMVPDGVEAVFVVDTLDAALEDAFAYAVRSDFFGEIDDDGEAAATIRSLLQRTKEMEADPPRKETVYVKRVYRW